MIVGATCGRPRAFTERPYECGDLDLSTDPKCPKIFVFSHPNHAEGVYIINSVGIAYHQCEALYIIKPQVDARWRVMIYKGGIAALDDIPPCGG